MAIQYMKSFIIHQDNSNLNQNYIKISKMKKKKKKKVPNVDKGLEQKELFQILKQEPKELFWVLDKNLK